LAWKRPSCQHKWRSDFLKSFWVSRHGVIHLRFEPGATAALCGHQTSRHCQSKCTGWRSWGLSVSNRVCLAPENQPARSATSIHRPRSSAWS
jgi:hypothetical protein